MKLKLRSLFVPLLSAFLGGLLVFLAFKTSPALVYKYLNTEDHFLSHQKSIKENRRHLFGPLFDDNFFSGFDVLDTMGSMNEEISQREDDHFVYFDIKVKDLGSTSLNTKIEDGYVTITGTTEKKSTSGSNDDPEGASSQSFFKSSFNRSFPLPENINQGEMEMIPQGDKIVLKFPKLKT